MSRELDKQVAEALGWQDVRWEKANTVRGGVLVGHNPRSTYAWCEVPFFKESIAAVWELVGLMAQECEYVDLEIYKNSTLCILILDDEAVPELIWREASTTPKAICETFLVWKEATND